MLRKTIAGTTGFSIAMSGLASAIGLCCFAPWAVPLLGVSGAILFARLGPYRGYFLVLAALSMTAALWGGYRYRKACAVDGKERRYFTWLNVLLLAGLLLLAAAAFAGRLQALLTAQPWS